MNNGNQSEVTKDSIPVSDWKRNVERLRVGHHIRNRRGEIGVITWIGDSRCYCYRLGTRQLNKH